MRVDPPGTTTGVEQDVVNHTQHENGTNPINYIFDVSRYRNNDALDADFQKAVIQIQNTDLGVNIQVLLIDILRTFATIRQQQTNIAQQQADQALKQAEVVAIAQRNQARATGTAEFINAGASMGQALGDAVVQASSAMYAHTKNAAIQKQAATMDFSNQNTAPARPSSAPPAYTEVDGGAQKTLPSDFVDVANDTKSGSSKGSSKGSSAGGEDGTPGIVDPQADAARQQWITNAQRNMYSGLEMKSHLTTALVNIGASITKMAAAQQDIKAGTHQAEATIAQAIEQYFNNQYQFDTQYAQQLKETISQALQFAAQIESARHQSGNALANI